MDLYRVNAIQETLDFGIDEYLFSQSGYCFIEWADIINSNTTITILQN